MVGKLVSERNSVRYRFGSPFSSIAVACEHCLVTLSLTFNETLSEWLSALPILMQTGIYSPSSPTSIPPFPPFCPSLISLMVSVDVKHHVYLLVLNVHRTRKAY